LVGNTGRQQAGWRNSHSYNEHNQNSGAVKKNPNFVRTPKGVNNQSGSFKKRSHNSARYGQDQPAPEPMEVDTSSRLKQPTTWQKGQSARSRQKIYFMPEENTDE